MSLKKAGFFRELRHGDPAALSIVEAKGKLVGAKPADLCRYLTTGAVLAATGSMVNDWFDPAKTNVARLELLTDGKWVWPSDLAYYVDAYQVALPADFIERMSEAGWKAVALTRAQLLAAETEFLGD